MHHRDFSEIMRNLYVGDQLTALDRTELLALGVKHIVVAGE